MPDSDSFDEVAQSTRLHADSGEPGEDSIELPQQIGRYEVESVLGRGGFGTVYLARDHALDRRVAIKVPAPELIEDGEIELYTKEARAVGRLDHPHIVPVYDVGSSNEFPFYVVSKYIDGPNLSDLMRSRGLTYAEAAKLVSAIAKALHFGHQKGIVHRDVKPANIQIARDGTPHLVDYGLAIQEHSPLTTMPLAGTPAYMSPEQARGEAHRIDGRSDIFSLGSVLYRLITRRKPFRGDSADKMMESVSQSDPKPPRQIDDQIPRELERICLKALARRKSDRYTTALDFANDLEYVVEKLNGAGITAKASRNPADTEVDSSRCSRATDESAASQATVISWSESAARLVPKGLRSFDQHDADFFLELLPGARDREGMPDSIRFWKTRLEELDGDATFPTGLIYGPSGCGKSSFMKAGLLPSLGDHVTTVYLEATADETETRLLHGLRKQIPQLSNRFSLVETLRVLRQRNGLPPGGKVLIIIDQFEQWLHARMGRDDRELIDAIRQCDGGRVQCVVMIRDDFWMAATRFMREMEVPLLEGENSLAVDLFQKRHAKRVLAAFGRAFGDLPQDPARLSAEHNAFLEQAIEGMAEDGKVICVRLALFAQMLQGKPWTPASLRDVGGAEGVGAAFLEETFSSKTAPPLHRVHQHAIRAVLRQLLPEQGINIKGHMRSRQELQEAAGYESMPSEFQEMMGVLDHQLRLVTPTDPEGAADDAELKEPNQVGGYYQLTHDFLVPSLRDWLSRKQRETYRGRAAIRLAETAAFWMDKPESKRLPSLGQWIRFLTLTNSSQRSESEQRMMASAFRHHSIRVAVAALVIAISAWAVQRQRTSLQSTALLDQLMTAKLESVPGLIEQLDGNPMWKTADVVNRTERFPGDVDRQIRAGLLLAPKDEAQVDFLVQQLDTANPHQLELICQRLAHCQRLDIQKLTTNLNDKSQTDDARFNAALAIAWQVSRSKADAIEALGSNSDFIVDQLIQRTLAHPGQAAKLIELIEPVKTILMTPLRSKFIADNETQRLVATSLVEEFADNMPEYLPEFLANANRDQFTLLFPKLLSYQAQAIEYFHQLLRETDDSRPGSGRDRTGRRRANAAICLMKLGQPDRAWTVFNHRPNPEPRSWVVRRSVEFGVSLQLLIEKFLDTDDPELQFGLLLAIGGYSPTDIDKKTLQVFTERISRMHSEHPNSGLRSVTRWLSNEWDIELDRVRNYRLDPEGPRKWYVAVQDHEMVVLDAREDESIGHVFDIGTTEVTIKQGLTCYPNKTIKQQYRLADDCPIGLVTWYQAIAYCQWLNVQAGIPEDQWCYPKFDPDQPDLRPMKVDISKTGFRLPTNAEWEFACRSGSETTRFFGDSVQLFTDYAWTFSNATQPIHPVATRRPNDFGMFDMYGNINEWRADLTNMGQVGVGGGSSRTFEESMTSDDHGAAVPDTRFNSYGFRVARTRIVER